MPQLSLHILQSTDKSHVYHVQVAVRIEQEFNFAFRWQTYCNVLDRLWDIVEAEGGGM